MWLVFSLLSRFLWAGGGAGDQVLARAHAHQKILSPLILEFCLLGPFVVAAYFLADKVVWSWPLFCLMLGGLAAYVIALLPYYRCLQEEQAYNIVPYLELTPVFLTLMAMAIYHERLAPAQMLGAFIVILCGFVFSWDFRYGKIKGRVFALMAFSALLFAVHQLSLRAAGVFGDVWMVTFYFSVGEFMLGVIGFLVLKKVRRSIISTAVATRGKTVLLSVLVASACFLALASLVYAFQIAPSTGHVASLSAVQPFFSFFIAAVLGRMLPVHFEPIVRGRELKWKLFLLVGIFCGIYLLARG